jgi:Nucleotidyl transferase AbiEii toxin, Type IV TA system
VATRIAEIAGQSDESDGVEFLTATAVARPIREDAFYPGVRVGMDSRIATAVVRFRLDVNVGDPVTPAPRMITLPSLRPDSAAVRMLGYPIETVLADHLATAIMLGAANTRVRDHADIYTLTGRHDLTHAVRAALDATARFRGVELVPLSSVIRRACRVARTHVPRVPHRARCRRRRASDRLR